VKRFISILLFLFASQVYAELVSIEWKTDRENIHVWEIFVDGQLHAGIAGSSREAGIDVDPGYHCFKMRGHPFIGRPTKFSDIVCQHTDSGDTTDILIDFNGIYL
jgi:hypothetical protein